jgi:cystathionine beta-lyase/cystathionine gamma-synthase
MVHLKCGIVTAGQVHGRRSTVRMVNSVTSRTLGSTTKPEGSRGFEGSGEANVAAKGKTAKGVSLDTLYATAGCEHSCPTTGAVIPPLHLSTTYERQKDTLELTGGFNYSRLGNPTRILLEETFAKLEGGTRAMACSSGMQACTSIILARPNCHIIIPDDLYHGLFSLVEDVFGPWGATHDKVDMTNHEAFEKVVKSAKAKYGSSKKYMVWLETPSNPKGKLTDVEHVSRTAKNILGTDQCCVVVDSTWVTPYILRPLEFGADVVMHSTTKYIGGHSDVLGGLVVVGDTPVAKEMHKSLDVVHRIGGGVCGPLESYLCLRGLRSLPVRLRRQCESALTIAKFLAEHPRISVVHYPGLTSHPQHTLALKQMNGMYGGMLSFELKDFKGDGNLEESAKQVGQKFVRVACFQFIPKML